MKKTKILASFVLTGIVLTGCSVSSNSENTPTGVASSEASPSPKNKPSDSSPVASSPSSTLDIQENVIKDKPLGIDIDLSLKESSTREVAQYAKKHDVKKAVQVGLSVYEELVETESFYMKRDISKDVDVIDALKTRKLLSDNIVSDMKKEDGSNGVFNVDKDARFGYEDKNGKHVSYLLEGTPTSTYYTPELSITDAGQLAINGWRYLTVSTDKGVYELKMHYWIAVEADKNDGFKVDILGFNSDLNKGMELVSK